MTIRFNCVFLCILFSGCVPLVKISYPPEAVIHPAFDQPYTIWRRERVQVDWTPSLHAESFILSEVRSGAPGRLDGGESWILLDPPQQNHAVAKRRAFEMVAWTSVPNV